MSVTTDIVSTYKGPRRVLARLFAMGEREAFALIVIIGACIVAFVSRWPGLARQAHESGAELNALLGGALMGWIMAPLLFYAIAAIAHILAMIVGGKGTWYRARLAMFWALLAASPLQLLWGLVEGFIGEGLEWQIVGVVWFAVFVWFWIAGMFEAERAD